MPSMTNILLKKDDGTDNTYYPVTDRPSPHWRTNVSGIGDSGQARLEFQTEKMKNGKTRANLKVTQPIMEVIPSGSVNAMGIQAAPMVADEESVSITFYLSPRGTNETRADLFRQVAHLLQGAGANTTMNLVVSGVTADVIRDCAAASPVPYGIVNLLWPGS